MVVLPKYGLKVWKIIHAQCRTNVLFIYMSRKLKEECGDVYTMLDLLVEWDVLSWTEIEERR